MTRIRIMILWLTASRLRLMLVAAAGSAALLVAVQVFQAFGIEPCKLCWWQRYPHYTAVAVGLVALLIGPRLPLAWLGAAAVLASALIGVYHTGVERHWWAGPDTCTSGAISGQSTQDLLSQIMTAPLVRCDEVLFSFLGLSLASWNVVFAIGLMGVWIAAARRN